MKGTMSCPVKGKALKKNPHSWRPSGWVIAENGTSTLVNERSFPLLDSGLELDFVGALRPRGVARCFDTVHEGHATGRRPPP